MNNIELLIFDLDGTLVNSREDIIAAIRHSIRHVGGSEPGNETLTVHLGRPLFNIMFDLLGDGNSDRAREATEEYRRFFFDNCAHYTKPYPGVLETLQRLDGKYRLAVATTKMTFMADRVLELLDMQRYFDLVQGTEGFEPKPAPDIVRVVTDKLSVNASENKVWMIGDRKSDILSGKAAGVSTCFAGYGFGSEQERLEACADAEIDSFSELPAALGIELSGE